MNRIFLCSSRYPLLSDIDTMCRVNKTDPVHTIRFFGNSSLTDICELQIEEAITITIEHSAFINLSFLGKLKTLTTYLDIVSNRFLIVFSGL